MKEPTKQQATADVAGQCEHLVSSRHIELLEHSLGDKTHYRNFFLASEGHSDSPQLEELVEMGLMVKKTAPEWLCGDTVYHVTDEGKKKAFAC
jgi:hypothetical protein